MGMFCFNESSCLSHTALFASTEGSAASPISELHLELKPDPPQPGKDLTIAGSATITSIPGGFSGASIYSEGVYFGQTFMKETNDLCDSLDNTTSACPFKSGVNVSAKFSTSNFFPNESWHQSSYVILHSIKDADGNFLSCMERNVVLGEEAERKNQPSVQRSRSRASALSQSSQKVSVRVVDTDDSTLPGLTSIPSAADLAAPYSFDAETQWPALKKTPGSQGQCGSWYVFSCLASHSLYLTHSLHRALCVAAGHGPSQTSSLAG